MILIVLQTTSVYATEYAYSIGCKFASGITNFAGDDFTANVKSASSIYAQISGVTSYYNTEPTYAYMKGNNSNGKRRIASYIVFLNGHANASMLISGAVNSTDYRTGVYTGNDGAIAQDNVTSYTLAGLSSTDMSSVGIITFAGCKTGAWPNTQLNGSSTNLVLKAVERGANAAVGFRQDVSTRYYGGPQWLNTYNTSLKNGYTVDGAITAACVAYPNSDLSSCVMGEGNVHSSIIPVRSAVFAESDLESQYYTISSDNVNFTSLNENIYNESLSEHSLKFEDIIEKIKEQDETFDINDYKVTYNKINEEVGFEHIFFTKYINQEIETNKVYLAVVKNGKVDNIILAGITKDNLRTIEDDVDTWQNKIYQFEQNKATTIQNIDNQEIDLSNVKLQANKNIDQSTIAVEDVKEKYYYDYNTNELKYIMQCIKECDLGTKSVQAVEIVI